jgi:acetyl-CoA carboxylase carboxyl transferase alpha subunit/acetyl-CoA carboxylase carboxyl transferase beta subunit
MSSPSPSEVAIPATTAEEEPQWVRCPACDAFVYRRRLRRGLGVCPECNHHFRLALGERLAQLLDEGSLVDLTGDLEPVDVLSFVDSKPYPVRIEQAQRKTASRSGALWGTGAIDGCPVVLAALDFAFIGGSLGATAGEAITRAAEHALQTRTPLLVISASGGARMQEGCVALMQLAKTTQAIARLHEEGVLYVSLLLDPTYGGVTASFATLGDILVAEPGVYIGFAGRRVIEQTIGQTLPEGFQTAEFLLAHGMLDVLEPRESLRRSLRRTLELHRGDRRGALPVAGGDPPATDPTALPDRSAWEIVQLARQSDRPTTLEYIGFLFDDFQELQGDRLYAQDGAIVGGLARLGELTMVVIGHQKGHTTAELVERNFGMPQPEGYRKALRLMRHAAKFGMPVLTLVDSPGAYPGIGAEERGQALAIAESIMEMSRLPVPTLAVVTGEGGSGGAIALAVADRVLMMENAYYSVISPEGCSTILFGDAAAAPRAAAALRLTARDLLELGVVDAVVREPADGAHTDPAAAALSLKAAVVGCLAELLDSPPEALLSERYDRFRAFGDPARQPTLGPLEDAHERA